MDRGQKVSAVGQRTTFFSLLILLILASIDCVERLLAILRIPVATGHSVIIPVGLKRDGASAHLPNPFIQELQLRFKIQLARAHHKIILFRRFLFKLNFPMFCEPLCLINYLGRQVGNEQACPGLSNVLFAKAAPTLRLAGQ
jgi:hypothetical protein